MRSASFRATVLFPAPAGPSIAITSGSDMEDYYMDFPIYGKDISLDSSYVEAAVKNDGLNSLKSFLNFRHPISEHDRAAVRTSHGTFRFCQFPQKPLHFVSVERHIDLHRRVAGDRCGNLQPQALQRNRPRLPAHTIQNFEQQAVDIVGADIRGRRFNGHRALAERLNLKPVRA